MIISIRIILIEKYLKFLPFSPTINRLTVQNLKGLAAIIWALSTTILKKIHVTVIYLNGINIYIYVNKITKHEFPG